MSVTTEQVANIAHLARLKLNEQDIAKHQQHLSKILTLIEQMQQINTENIQPMAHPLDVTQRCRPDEVTEKHQPELMNNAPLKEAGVFLVPAVLE